MVCSYRYMCHGYKHRKIGIDKTTSRFYDKMVKEWISGNSGPKNNEFKEKLRQANIGKTLSEEHKQKISKAHRGKSKPMSEETKKKISISMTGIKFNNRKPFSDEYKKKKSEQMKAYRARMRNGSE